jgi:phosphoribosylanthranilate isomerase
MDTRIGAAYGGTGQPFNRQLAKEVSMRFPVVIAGGLTPKNIGELLLEVKPWGVDVSSGVETDGRKDNSKIKAFIELVRKAERCAESSKGGSLDSI